ncbi:TPA: ead/Ea22-like family protein [Klebsiella pneumoniae]|nr:ead/Ea22-like family protein [Klebsiella pneumoniae]
MTTDITELAQRMKAAAEKATHGQWLVTEQDCRWNIDDESGRAIAIAQQRTPIRDDYKQAERTANAEFIALANPANILALVEALEKAQQKIDELENDEVRQRLANAEHQLYMAELAKHNLKASRKSQFRKRRAAEKRIAELESRAVKLPKKNIGWDRDEEDCWNNAIDACAEVLAAAGIKVEAE